MNRMTIWVGQQLQKSGEAMLLSIREECAEEIKTLRRISDMLDSVGVGRPKGSTKDPVSAEALAKYGPSRFTFHNPAAQDKGGME